MENRIAELRKEKRLSQVSLSIALGVSQETVSAYETGKHDPTIDNLIKLADFFQVSTDYLMKRTDYRKPQSADQLPPEDLEVLSIFHDVKPHSRERALRYFRGFVEKENSAG